MPQASNADCIFCDVTGGREGDADDARDRLDRDVGPVDPDTVVLADDVVVAFLDRSPLFVGHTLVVPRVHVVTLTDLPPDLVGPFFERVRLVAAAMPIATGKPGTFVANNNIVSQSVAHLHVHVVPRQRGDGLRGFFWPRTRYASGEAAATATALRAAIGTISDSDGAGFA